MKETEGDGDWNIRDWINISECEAKDSKFEYFECKKKRAIEDKKDNMEQEVLESLNNQEEEKEES